MANEAEKKNISRLDFDVNDAIKSLDLVNQKLETISKSSETYAKKIGNNLKSSFDFGNLLNADSLSKELSKVTNISESDAKKMVAKIMSQEISVTANAKKEAEKRKTIKIKATTDVYKSEAKTADKIKVIEANTTAYKEKRAADAALAQEKANLKVLNSTKTLYDKVAEYAKTYIIYQGFNQLRKAAMDSIEAMKAVEYRMMEISRIMEEGSIDVNQYRDSLIDLAYQYGRSFDDVSTVTLNFARAGYDAQDAIAMTEQSLLALNTAELDAEQATEGLISILAQWDMNTGTTAEKSQNLADVIDKINKTADNFPISSEGLLEALKRTSQGFNLAGATIDETIAMIVAAETASQRGGKIIGTAMANMQQQLKAEGKMNLAESLGLDFFEDEAKTKFKSVTEIFALMSQRMQELEEAGKGSSTEMQSLLELFTVFRRNIGAGLLSEMSGEDSTYMQALTNSLDAAGYSAQENSKYMGTMEAATQQLNATILDLQSTLYDEGGKSLFTGFILAAEGGINIINAMIEKFGVLPTTIAAVTLAMNLLNKNMGYAGIKKFTLQLGEANAALKLYNQTVLKGEMTSKDFNNVMGKDISQNMQKYIKGLNGAEASMGGFIAKTIGAKAAQIALNVAIAAGQAAMTFGLSIAIQAIVEAIQNWINATDIAAESIADMNSNLDTTVSELENYASKFESIRKEMNLSNTTQEEYNSKKKDLITLQQELIDKFGDEAKGINLVTGEINEQKEAIEALAKTDYKKYIQENQKEINKLAKTFQEESSKTLNLTDFWGFTPSELEKIKDYISMEGVAGPEEAAWVQITGTPEEILETYRKVYDKLLEYQNENAKKMNDSDQERLKGIIEQTSETINKLEEKYGENLTTYKNFLQNRLQYDERYSTDYAKIVEGRAKLTEALTSGDQGKIEKAQSDLTEIYNKAIENAKNDPQVSDGMVALLQKQIENLNESTELEQIKLKVGVDSKEIHDSIQEIISDMGDISFEDLEDGLGAEILTENMAKLKEQLDVNGISVKDFIDNFTTLGFHMGEVAEVTEETTDKMYSSKEILQEVTSQIGALQEKYTTLTTAQNELAESGRLTVETMNNLISKNLLDYLTVADGKLRVNTQSVDALAESYRINAIETLKSQAVQDLENLTLGETENLSMVAKNALAKLKEGQQGLSTQTKTTTTDLLGLVAALNEVAEANARAVGEDPTTGISAEEYTKKATAIVNAYKGIAKQIGSISLSAATRKNTSGGGGSSSANRDAERAAEEAKKEAEEAYKARLKAFEDYIKNIEEDESNWVKRQKELGLLSNKDFMYITKQRLERYKKYLEEVKKATWMNEEDKLKLQREYSEEIKDLEVDYLGYLKDQLDDEIEALEDATDEKIKLIEAEADAKIAALDKVSEATDRAREKEDYENERQSILEEIAYWEQRTGREAQEALLEAKKKLAELDAEWEDTQEDWSIEDQIKQIEEERDAEIKALEDARDAEIKAMQEVYDAKLKMFVETGEIIYEGSVIQAQSLYNAYKKNFIDPINSDLANLNQPNVSGSASTEAQKQYESYTIKAGDTLSKIARKFGTTVEKIMAANPYITNKNKIFAGKTLQIPKFHEGGIVGGTQEAFALLKPHEVILKPEWADGINKLAKMARTADNPISNGPVVEVKGDLVRIDAKINDKTDAEYLTRRIEKMLKDKFNIKK